MITPRILQLLAGAHAQAWLVYGTELRELVDILQEFAEQTGLVAAIGQDAVQQMIAEPFGIVRPLVEARAAQLQCLDLEPEQEPTAREYRTPNATIDAFKLVLARGRADELRKWLQDHPRDVPTLRKVAEAA